ncbi:MAG: hypothetical protein VKJ64_04810, partial [Leptolyngbyaceae bacterium]|nr:hypothetical protein [Leptolyngbyaceae bacterium]
MPAPFPHPEPPNTSVMSIPSDTRSSAFRSEPFSDDPDQDCSPTTSPLAETTAEMMALRQAAQRGEFRAIAALLNQTLHRHGIVAWVGEAGPGCLQITLTVKRPPQQEPLLRIIAHQLCLLQSEVILGANLTAQLAATNLILWHKLVRLPSHRPTTPPATNSSQGKPWQPLQATLQSAEQQGRNLVNQVQPMVRQVWQQRWPQVRDGLLSQYEKVRSLSSRPFQPPQPSNPIPASASPQPSLSAIVPPEQTQTATDPNLSSHRPGPDLESIPKPTSPFQADSSLEEKTPGSLLSLPLRATDENQWTELAMLPVAWSAPPPSPTLTTERPEEGATSPPTPPPQVTMDPASADPALAHPQPAWLATLDQVQTTLQDQIIHPN